MGQSLSDDDIERIRRVYDSEGLIAAVKVHREMSGDSLAKSKAFVEGLERGESAPCDSNDGPHEARRLSDDTVRVISDHLADGQKIHAIKVYRDATGSSLIEAKEFIETLMVRLREEDPQRFAKSKSGCAGVLLMASLGPLLVAFLVIMLR